MMEVYIVGAGFFPYGMAPIKRRLCLAKSLINAGLSCKILIFAARDNRLNDEGKGTRYGEFEGVPYEIIGNDVSSNFPIITKIRSLISMLKLLFYLKRKLKANDVVYSYVHDKYTTRYMNCVINIVHSKGAKYVRELCELPFGKGKETKETVINRKIVLENQFPKYDGVLAISQSLADLAQQYTNPTCRVFKLPILVEYEKYALEDKSDFVKTPYIFHSGTLTEQKDGILGMLEAFGRAVQQTLTPIKFISTGEKENSQFYEEINRIIDKYNLSDKLFFIGYVTDEELKDYLQKASLVIINKYPTQQNQYCFSTKLGEYMAAGKPIIITNVGEAMNWLTDREDSLIVESQNVGALTNAIIELFSNNILRKGIGKKARQVCLNSFDYRVYSDQLKKFFTFE